MPVSILHAGNSSKLNILWDLCSNENLKILRTLQFSSPSSILLSPLTLSILKVFKLTCQSYQRCLMY